MAEPESKRVQVLAGVLVVAGGIYWFTIGQERAVTSGVADIEAKVASDAAAQYEIAKRQGDPIQTCVQAGMVSAAFLQAKNEPEYQRWKAVEAADCARAGVPR